MLDEQEHEVDEPEPSLHERLKRVWRNERCAPTLLNYEADLVIGVRTRVRDQEDEIANIRASAPDSTTSFLVDLLELEVDRFKFL